MIKTKIASDENREFYKMLLIICLPIILQNFISVLVNLIDTVMVGQLGDIAIASVGLSNQVFFVINLIMLGIASGIAVFMTQFWGKKDYEGLHKSIIFGLVIVIPIVLIAIGFTFFVPEKLLRIFTLDNEVIFEGSKYLKIVGFSYLPTGIVIFLNYALRSTDRIKYAVLVTLLALTVNVILNYFLIFGKWIFPELGIVGSAIATLIARYIQLIVLLLIIYLKNMPIAIKSLALFRIDTSFINRFIKTSGNVFLNETLYGVGVALFFTVYGRLGTYVAAGTSVAKTIENLVWIFFWSLCAAASVSIGKLIGAQHYAKAQRYAYKFIVTSFISSIVLALILLIITNPVLSLFDTSNMAKSAAKLYINIFVVAILFRGPLKVLSSGVLRAGGDTGFVMLWDVIPMWIALLLCYVGAIYFDLSVIVIFTLAIGYEIIKIVPLLIRVKNKKWINNLVN